MRKFDLDIHRRDDGKFLIVDPVGEPVYLPFDSRREAEIALFDIWQETRPVEAERRIAA